MNRNIKLFITIFISIIIIVDTGSTFTLAATSNETRIATGVLKNVAYDSNENGEGVEITLANYSDYSIMRLSSPERIVIDIYNAIAPGKQQSIQANGRMINSIRYAQFDTYTARVVLDVNGQEEYGIDVSKTIIKLYFGDNPAENDKDKTNNENTSPSASAEPISPDQEKAVFKKLSINKYFNIEYTPEIDKEQVAILLSNYSKYTVKRLTGPDRLVVDIPNTKYSSTPKQITTNGIQIKSISYSKFSSKISRITFNLLGQSRYDIRESKGKLIFTIAKPTFSSLRYYNNGDRVYLILDGAKLTTGDEILKKLYTGNYELQGLRYVITFPTKQANIEEGILGINDGYLKSIIVKKSIATGKTSITFNAVKKFSYLVYTRDNLGETAITILKPAEKSEKLVVIDAGHGGQMPGAIYKGLYEKEMNLDIALKLNKLLLQKKVKTYMLRQDDSDISNYERAYIANMLGASLFLSIHTNALDDPSYSGTMTLYCPQNNSVAGFTGRKMADIVQQKLLDRLKTVDRKTIERPNLVVLKATSMPSALAEVAFITNATDRNNLKRDTFRQKTAQALGDAIIECISYLK